MDEVKEHRDLMSELIGVKPRIFRNTEMLYNNSVAYFAAKLGYDAILTEGIETILHGRSPVITSYSIHYTKLYDSAVYARGQRNGYKNNTLDFSKVLELLDY